MVLQVLKTFYRYQNIIIAKTGNNKFIVVFSQDAAKVCQNFMSRDPSELHFTVVALSAAP